MTSLVIGKFYPPHRGHKYLIDTALGVGGVLHVIVCERPGERPDGTRRLAWIREWYGDGKTITYHLITDVYPQDDSQVWADLCKGWIGGVPDRVFTSEDYGDRFAQCLGCEHVKVDVGRRRVPISGTRIRESPFTHLEYLEPNVGAWYLPRIVVVGAESTGKTTLAERLATHYGTEWIAEAGRAFCEERIESGTIEQYVWKTDDFVEIATRQTTAENDGAMRSVRRGARLLICDTDPFATSIWHERYVGAVSAEVERIATEHDRGVHTQVYLLADNGVAFVQDGYRDGEGIRDWMYGRFVEELQRRGKRYHVLTGSYEDRFRLAIGVVDSLVSGRSTGPGLEGPA